MGRSTLTFVVTYVFAFCVFFLPGIVAHAQQIYFATSTVVVSICGDAIVTPGEVCDLGVASNTGAYASSIADRKCNSDCLAYAPYCGDGILQTIYSETCDDGNNQNGDFCSATCQAEPAPHSSGGGGGGGGGSSGYIGGSFIPVPNASVSISGKAYPNADVNILQDGNVIGVVKADAGANFYFTTTNITPGSVTFGFWAQDGNGLRSVSFTTTFHVAQSAVTNISGIFIPPTISLNKQTFDKGETLTVSGQSVPQVTINTVVHSDEEITTQVPTDDKGNWTADIDTAPLSEDIHTVKAQFVSEVNGTETQSGFSQALSFFIGKNFQNLVGSSDLNRDGFVNLIDFSILLFHWGTDGGSSDPPADINGDGSVNLVDFSVMLANWTG